MIKKENVVIRLCGDSGDGMQLIGQELANTSATVGNDIGTFPDFPAEIRAPRGTVAGVSGFQINIGSYDIHTPGDKADCLIAMNPAALKSNLSYLKENGILVFDTNALSDKNLKLAGYTENPFENGSLDAYQLIQVDITGNTRKSLEQLELSHKMVDRCKNFYALGMVCYMYSRPIEHAIDTLKQKFQKKPEVVEANTLALKGGYAYCEMSEIVVAPTVVAPAELPAGKYRSISGNTATALGLVAAAEKAGLNLYYAGYPITPASDILHELVKLEHFNVKTFQAEDEIAAACAAVGASFAGTVGVTASSGPGIALKQETIGLATMTELPLVVINVQRGGPSTGLPTKTEQSDLMQAVFGRNGECPIPVLSASRPADVFETIYEAYRIAVKYMTPVMFLSDGYIANSSEPWLLPDTDNLPEIQVNTPIEGEEYIAYKRDEHTRARKWAIPGTEGFEHRIGGLEKQEHTGNVSYDPDNHDTMVYTRQEKVEAIQNDMTPMYQDGESEGDVLVIGWGSTYGSIRTALEMIRKKDPDAKVTHVHLRYIYPLQKELPKLIHNFREVIVPEMNTGQLIHLIRSKCLVDAKGFNQVRGVPFTSEEMAEKIEHALSLLVEHKSVR